MHEHLSRMNSNKIPQTNLTCKRWKQSVTLRKAMNQNVPLSYMKMIIMVIHFVKCVWYKQRFGLTFDTFRVVLNTDAFYYPLHHESSFENHAILTKKQFGQRKHFTLRSENEAHKNFTSLLKVSKKVSKYSFFSARIWRLWKISSSFRFITKAIICHYVKIASLLVYRSCHHLNVLI